MLQIVASLCYYHKWQLQIIIDASRVVNYDRNCVYNCGITYDRHLRSSFTMVICLKYRPLIGATTFSITTFSITTLSNTTLSTTISKLRHSVYCHFCYAEFLLCWTSLMLSVTNKPFMLSVVMLNVVMLNVVAPTDHCMSINTSIGFFKLLSIFKDLIL